MSDEIMNNGNGEETAALFVSSQKKKQAEEEAAKKAAEEKAKRDAAEAEVRRMEAEVEERKRKAEEERQALEEAARQAEADKANVAQRLKDSVNVEEIKSKVKEKTEGKSKLPIFIGAGAAAVVIIALIIGFALRGKGSKIDFETLEFAKEYTFTDENNSTVTLTYPESVFPEVSTEEEETLSVLTSNTDKSPAMMVCVSKPIMEKGVAGMYSAKAIEADFSDVVNKVLSSFKASDEKSTDLEAETPGKYFYDCTLTADNGQTGAAAAWLEPDSNGNMVVVIGVFTEKGEDPANSIKLRDLFEEKNADNALMLPGANPPASADTDGMLEIDAMHMGIIVPKDRFYLLDSDNELSWWSDDNGAVYSISYREVGFDFDMANAALGEVQPMLKDLAESAAGLKGLPNLDSRMFISDSWPNNLKYYSEYKDIIGGVTYWEANFASMWHDIRTDKYYIYDLVLMAPSNNQDIYKQLFDKAIDRLQDI
ncbi:MAG: hypothetical protein K6G57_06415 [Lachnospiraceae bacterium]|nr:hypothetical protein [Lachnospiraceae bacterium]